ncbi:MAG: MBL fold metallo-hydrolase [Bryobacteraceae bacterium]
MRSKSKWSPLSLRYVASGFLVLGCAFIGVRVEGQQPATPIAIDVVPVKPNFYMIAGAGGNIAVQIGPMGAILVDAGSAAAADKVLDAVNRISPKPIRYIINTSADADHTGGNQRLGKAGLTVLSGAVGQRGIDEDVLTNGGTASVLAHENVLQRMSRSNGAPEVLWPTKPYSGRGYSMYLNDAGIQIWHLPAAHSDGDSAVFFRQHDVIVTGDVIDADHFPTINTAIGGGIQGEIDALNRLIDMVIPPFPLVWQEARTFIVPGHGRVIDQHDIVEYRDMVVISRDLIQDLAKQGKTLEQVKAANPTKAYRTRYGADSGTWTTDMFVEAVYKGVTAGK